MDEKYPSKRSVQLPKRGERIVKSVMITAGMKKTSRRAVLLTRLAAESFIIALTRDASVFKPDKQKLKVEHLLRALTGSDRYGFVKSAVHKFQMEYGLHTSQVHRSSQSKIKHESVPCCSKFALRGISMPNGTKIMQSLSLNKSKNNRSKASDQTVTESLQTQQETLTERKTDSESALSRGSGSNLNVLGGTSSSATRPSKLRQMINESHAHDDGNHSDDE